MDIGRGFALLMVTLFCGHSAFAQKLVDPSTVAPEFRAAAEKRRAEQIKLSGCMHKADEAKVLRRDKAEYIGQCLEK